MRIRQCITLIAGFLLIPVLILQAQVYKQEVIVSNPGTWDKKDAPVVIALRDIEIPFRIKSALVFEKDREIPVQLDDLDKDGIYDELVFVTDMPALSTRTFHIHFSTDTMIKKYPPRVFAEMLMRGDKGKHQPITSLTVPGNSDVYNLLHHHGPAFESELTAYRIYFDRKQTVDIYGKFHQQLEIEESQFYPTDEQLERGFGDDVLRVGGSAGLGTLKGWNGEKAVHIDPVGTRTESILASGPLRTVVDVTATNWAYQGSLLNMKIRYILYAGHRDCEVQVYFDYPLKSEMFAIGIQNIKGSTSFSDQKGVVACWGTDWPVNDTVKYAKETVGLALALPEKIVREQKQDNINYLYTVQAEGSSSFTYYITFTSMKETFGYKTSEEWFAFVRQWRRDLLHPVTVQLKR